jgi:hypothetical protein
MVQVLPERAPKPRNPDWRDALVAALQGGMEGYEQGRENAALEEQGLNLSGIKNPELRKTLLSQQLTGKALQQKQKDEREKAEKLVEFIEDQRGLERGSLRGAINDPRLAEQISRPEKSLHSDKAIDPEQLKIIERVRQSPEYQEAGPSKKYQIMTSSGVSRENAKSESDIFSEEQKPSMFESESSKLAAKSSSEYRDRIVKEYEGAVASDMRLDKMIDKAKSKKLPTPLMVKTLDVFGLPLSILNNPEGEEYAKLQADYVRDVSTIFPGAIKNFEIESYMKTIPGLINSDEGKILIGENLKIRNEAYKMKYQAMKEILKENGGVPPRNLDIAINDRTQDKMQSLSERFRQNVHDSLDLSGPKITMVDSDGRLYDIPSREIESAINEGLNIYNE